MKLRCRGDEQLFAVLSQHPIVKKAHHSLAIQGNSGARRQLLATSVQLTHSMAPKLHEILEDSKKILEMNMQVELYVYSSAQMNAACLKPEDERLIVILSSALLENFDEQELRFVVGHELGHHLFRHHDVPVGYLVKGKSRITPQLALQLFAWSRYAEISADRAGAACCKDREATGRALFKLASGVASRWIEIRLDDFASQADELGEMNHGRHAERDWYMTHPFSPLRVKALQLVHDENLSEDQLEAKIDQLLEVMSPNYLEGKTEEAKILRNFLFAAGCELMLLDGLVETQEWQAFENLLGEGSWGDHLNLEKLSKEFDRRLKLVKEKVSLRLRDQVLRDLTLIALADGPLSDKEQTWLRILGKKLGLRTQSVEAAISPEVELD